MNIYRFQIVPKVSNEQCLIVNAYTCNMIIILYNIAYYRDIAGHERFWHMTRVYYKYALV